MKWPLILLFAGSLLSADVPGTRLFYSKAFPGSVPAYVQVTVDPDGQAEDRDAAVCGGEEGHQ